MKPGAAPIKPLIAITGAGGFIGTQLSGDLLRRGFVVRALSRDPGRLDTRLERFPCRDLTDIAALRSAFRGATTVIHLAGRAHVMREHNDPEGLYRAINVEGTRNVAEAAAAESVRQIIFSSSVKAIGEGGVTELNDSTQPKPADAYGRSKLEAEQALYEIARRSGIAATVMRFPLVYGPGVKGNMMRLFDAVWNGMPLPLGRVDNRRSMINTANIAAFVSEAIDRPLGTDLPFLVSDSDTVSTKSLAQMIGRGLGRKPNTVAVPVAFLRAIGRMGDAVEKVGIHLPNGAQIERLVGSLVIDSSRAWKAVNVYPPQSLEEGIRVTAEWYRTTRRR